MSFLETDPLSMAPRGRERDYEIMEKGRSCFSRSPSSDKEEERSSLEDFHLIIVGGKKNYPGHEGRHFSTGRKGKDGDHSTPAKERFSSV